MLQFFDLFDHPGHRRIAATFDGKADSRVSAVYDAQPRHSFIVAMKGIAKLWEIGYGAGDAAASGGPGGAAPHAARCPARRLRLRSGLRTRDRHDAQRRQPGPGSA